MIMSKRCLRALYLVFSVSMAVACGPDDGDLDVDTTARGASPYPASSPVIASVSFNFGSRVQDALGADNWPVTWAANNQQYTSWGDGWGFRDLTAPPDPKISIGLSSLTGAAASFSRADLWLGDEQGSNDPNDGKSYGLLAIGNVLYMWVSPGSGVDGYEKSTLWKSSNFGDSWTKATWSFTEADGLINPVFLQKGKGYANSDGYVYIYAAHLNSPGGTSLSIQKPGEIALIRVPEASLMTRSAYRFYGGLNANGAPIWKANIVDRVPVFVDPAGVSWNTGSVSFNAGLNRYLLITEHGESTSGNIGIFDAPKPWGPWTTVHYANSFGSGSLSQTTFYWNFANRWLSSNGLNFYLVYSGTLTCNAATNGNDCFNMISGSFTRVP